MDPLSLTASIIAVIQTTLVIVDTCYQYKSTVSNSSKEVTRIIQQLNSLRSVLERLIEILDNESPDSTRLSTVASLARKDGPLEGCVRGLEELRVRLQPKTGWAKTKVALVWPLKEKEERKVLSDLNDMKTTLHFALETDHTALALEMHSQIEGLTHVADSIKADEHRREISKWLAAPNPFPSHNVARKKREPLTGMWFLNSKKFTNWIRNDGSFLWLHGIPGCGKSVLCSTAIERLYSISSQNPSIAIAYFYFDFQNFGSTGVQGMVCSLLLQLVNQSSDIPSEMEVLRKQFKDGEAPLPKLMGLLLVLAGRFQSTYFVIDALDECEELDEVLAVLEEFRKWKLDSLHIMVFSRRLPEIEQSMASTTVDSLSFSTSLISEDINLYIKQILRNDKRFSKWPLDVESEIYEAVSVGAHGMFRWVACQLDMLRNSLTLKSLRRDLRSLPSSLEETYDRILLKIPESHRPHAIRILAFLSFTARPVRIMEVAEMLAVDLESQPFPTYDAENRFADPQDILIMCSNLVIISTPTSEDLSVGEPYADDNNYTMETVMRNDFKIIRVAHLSVKDYLLSKRIKSSPASEFSIEPISANLVIAQTCIAYLLSPALVNGPCKWSKQRSRFESWPFLRYSALYWPHHTMASGPLDPALWNQISHFFATKALPNGGNYVGWINVLTPQSSQAHTTEPLYYAASFGMTDVVRMLLHENLGINIDAQGGRYSSSPLQVAVYRRHNEVAKLLLNAGANIDDKNSLGESSRLWAHVTGTPEIRALLRARGAISTARDEEELAAGRLGTLSYEEGKAAHVIRMRLIRGYEV